jgi:hypothetical protein
MVYCGGARSFSLWRQPWPIRGDLCLQVFNGDRNNHGTAILNRQGTVRQEIVAMAKKPNLPKFDLVKDDKKGDWKLEPEGGGRAKRRFDTKEDATKGGALSDALGGAGGSVRIRKTDGTIQEERTFPRDRDPKGSPG